MIAFVFTANEIAGATILAALAASGALIIGIAQAMRMREAWQAQNALEILRDIQSDDQRQKRGELFSLNGQGVPYEQWTEEQKRAADSTCSQLNAAAYLEQRRLLPPGMIEDIWGNVFRNLYTATEKHITARRQRGDSDMWSAYVKKAQSLLKKAPADPFYP